MILQAEGLSRANIVAEAMRKAKQEAELLKARKKLQKLLAAGHDVSLLKASYEGEQDLVVLSSF